MREIKFRAWDKENKLMLKVGTLFFESGNIKGFFKKGENWLRKSNFILMQYTGLKDKNGKEIYCGDICKYRRASPFYGGYGEERIGEVIFYNCRYCFRDITGTFIGHDGLSKFDEIEVIGNIYKNKDLLNK